jgi:hypothetical protein
MTVPVALAWAPMRTCCSRHDAVTGCVGMSCAQHVDPRQAVDVEAAYCFDQPLELVEELLAALTQAGVMAKLSGRADPLEVLHRLEDLDLFEL